jgi:peptide/nickel transport system substrate-binding protein
MHRRLLSGAAVFTLTLGLAAGADAATLHWASQGDALTFDPHAQNHGPTNTQTKQVYEALIVRAADQSMEPGLALSWEPVEPTAWEFRLRQGVKFHDGADFTAEDVVFSFARAQAETSDFRGYITSIDRVEAVDDHTVVIHTTGPNPILPNQLTELKMIDKGWAEANGVGVPQDFAGGEETYAVRNANGTGPFKLELREPDVRTVMVRNDAWWGLEQDPHNIDEIVYTPIHNDATRIAALLSGEVDFVLDPPLQDLARIEGTAGLKTVSTPQIRSIFFGLDQGSEDLRFTDGNPFKDVRVRRAIYQATDVEAIRSRIMRGLSAPAGTIAAPGVHGYTAELDARLPFDVEAAKALLAEAGYPDGFETTLNCPNDRYINDEAICQAMVAMLAQIGITVNLVAQPNSIHFQQLQNREHDFFMLGWGVPTLDSHYIFNFLLKSDGGWNFTGYSNERLDALTTGMEATVDLAARDAMIAEAWEIVQGDIVYVPLHHQVITWAMKDTLELPIEAQDSPQFRWARMAE